MTTIKDLYRLKKKDIDKASQVLRDAFMDYPTFKYLFPEITIRKKKLRYVMSFFLKCGLLQGVVVAPSVNLEGISIWYRSNNFQIGLNSLLKAGLISTIYHLGIKTFIRFKKIGDAKKENRDKLLDKEYFFLDLIGIDPSFQKQGYAKLLIDSIIEKADKEGVGCFLETSNIKNVDYYNKYGFVLLNNYKLEGLESYCMANKQRQINIC